MNSVFSSPLGRMVMLIGVIVIIAGGLAYAWLTTRSRKDDRD